MISDKAWNIILVFSVILIIHGMINAGDEDKKVAQAGQDEAAVGTVGALVSFAGKKAIAPVMIWTIVGVVAAVPFLFTQFRNLIAPPTIPGWVWIAGIGLLFFMVMMNKKN